MSKQIMKLLFLKIFEIWIFLDYLKRDIALKEIIILESKTVVFFLF